jgi:transposase
MLKSVPRLKLYVGLDVSLAETSIAIIDENDKLVWRGSVASTPEAIAKALAKHSPQAERIGLEAGQLSAWLYHGLKALGLPVICIDARHAKATLSLNVNKTDANDALGIARIMRVGWYREVTVKGHDCQALRALLVARAQIVSQVTTLKNCVRGILKTFGHVLPKKLRAGYIANVRDIVAGNATLELIVMPMLKTLAATIEQLQVYDQAVSRHAREDDTARLLMTAPGVGTIVVLGYMTGIGTPARFTRASAVGAYFGMTPRRYQSGEVDKAGRVSKCGDGMVRGLLFEAAKVLLSRTAKPSDLQAWGRSLIKRVGKKKATMAVARKLAVILHRMWTTGEPFQWIAPPAQTAA